MKKFMLGLLMVLFTISPAFAGETVLRGGGKVLDDEFLIFGTGDDIKFTYDEAGDNRLEASDGTNLLWWLTDAGTTGDMGVTGAFTATGALAGATLNTGQGAYELYAMNQDTETTDSPTFVTAKLSGLADGYIPYHVADATGLADSNLYKSGTNIGLGQTTFGTSAAKVLAIGSGTAPTTSPADSTQLWSADHHSAAGYARLYQRTEDGPTGPVAQLAEVTETVNTKAPSQAVEMTEATSGSTGITVADDDDIDFGTGDFTLVWRGSLSDWTPSSVQWLYYSYQDATHYTAFGVRDSGPSGHLSFETYDGTDIKFNTSVVTGIIDNVVAELVITMSSSGGNRTATFYVDGKVLGSETIASTVSLDLTSARYISGSLSKRTASRTEAAYTFNRALTASEVEDLYKNGPAYADKYGSQTSIITGNDSTFAGGSNWANVDINAFDSTGDLTITASAAAQYCTLPVANATTVAYRKYRLKFDVANLVSTWTIKSFDGTQTIGTISANGTGQTVEFTASTTGGIRLVAVADTSSMDLDNVYLYPIGVTLALEPSGIQIDSWKDSSTNGLNAAYPTSGSSLVLPIATSNGAILLSTTTVSLAADADTTLYTVPTGKRLVLSHAVLVAGDDAASTDISIGADGAETDFVSAYQCDNLDAAYDAIDIRPVPNSTPAKIKSYAAGTVIQAKVENQAGGATNTLYLFGFLY